ncbi:ABC transporter substrate-binding protein [Paracoccus laeviglucosivorans]|uniref:Thiamine pyrimidine synthase n=1 Tax=Paracoccus laeviglucosivorans TaxID=1197861 RepID=A0A521FNE2_9RHOB|nr:ABC transporter substrate-binding protein [Paracoccus laeviglucosivorans]SMO97707.1 NitT/TauT family transport system substrate-binding protein [Paracoccus laeviglucosivorans]
MQDFHITATGHSLNYLPEYVAGEQGFFEDEGLRVTASVPRPWDIVLDDLRQGRAEAALGGIWVPSMYLGRATRFVPFAQIANRAPLALVGREPADKFLWSGMAGKTALMKGSNGASVGLYLKMMLREQGVDPKALNYVQDLDGAMLSELFVGGLGDYLVIDYPGALKLVADGPYTIVQAFPMTGGDIPWSVYYATEGADPAAQAGFCRALGRAMSWIRKNDSGDYADFLARTFPRLPVEVLVRVTREYVGCNMWTSPRINPEGYARWQQGLADGHLIAAPIPYDTLIDGSVAA